MHACSSPPPGIPIPLRWLSYVFPTTWGASSMRSVMGRGWGIEEGTVWQAFLVILGWLAVFFALSVLAIRRTE